MQNILVWLNHISYRLLVSNGAAKVEFNLTKSVPNKAIFSVDWCSILKGLKTKPTGAINGWRCNESNQGKH